MSKIRTIVFLTLSIVLVSSLAYANTIIEDLNDAKWEEICKKPVVVSSALKLKNILDNPTSNNILNAVDSGKGFYVLCFKTATDPLQILKAISEITIYNNKLSVPLVFHNFELVKDPTFTGTNIVSISSSKPIILYQSTISGNVSVSGTGHIITGGSQINSISISNTASDILIKDIDILGPGIDVVDANGAKINTGISVAGNNVTISEINMVGKGTGVGIYLKGNNCKINEDTIIQNFETGIRISGLGNTIDKIDIIGVLRGMSVDANSSGHTISKNIIVGINAKDSKGIHVAGTNMTIGPENEISSFDKGIYLESTAQNVKITQDNFIDLLLEPIFLAVGANGNVQPIDTVSENKKIWRVMSKDEKAVEKVIGVLIGKGAVEIFKDADDQIIYQDNICTVTTKEGSDFSESESLPTGSFIFVCGSLNLKLDDFITFTFTDPNGNTSVLSNSIKLETLEAFPSSFPVPPADTPVQHITDDQTQVGGFEVLDGGGGGGGGSGVIQQVGSDGAPGKACTLIAETKRDLSATAILLIFAASILVQVFARRVLSK